jgi:hypothetical protein
MGDQRGRMGRKFQKEVRTCGSRGYLIVVLSNISSHFWYRITHTYFLLYIQLPKPTILEL